MNCSERIDYMKNIFWDCESASGNVKNWETCTNLSQMVMNFGGRSWSGLARPPSGWQINYKYQQSEFSKDFSFDTSDTEQQALPKVAQALH